MNRLEAMTVLLDVVDAGSLSAAGRRLGMPLASVSRKISSLEAHLKARLLNRSTRQLTLTEAGRTYVAACRRILEQVGDAERTAGGEYSAPRGDLTLTAPVVFGRLHVLPVVSDFLKTYPEIDMRLVLSDRVVHLLEDHIDVALRIGQLPDSSLVATQLGTVRRVICASPGHLSRHGAPKTPADLALHDCVTFEGLNSLAAWTFGAGKSEISVPIKPRLTVNTAEAAIDAAAAGVGITRVLSYQAASAVEEGRLAILLQEFEPAPLPVSLVHAGHGLLPLKLRAFLEFAAPQLRGRLAPSPLASPA
ncbi:LysR family transcriptional regulator [Mesorhizobium sp. LHD-90]|uniref:LysR family transcriptional regulator n=1 Tax=Mesorhizobium sp. LHD-90 TaxID=3071414 RepID=UPI0027E13A57|nr:LysR family transcriptional regulator [Mesorhizobium sp. LHD-90]MDQ6436996.1 LysR family transcriptional regulator [Mesorhizobium sp. LHD-90]